LIPGRLEITGSILLFLLLCPADSPCCAPVRDPMVPDVGREFSEHDSTEIPIGVQLEGLPPTARIAYLKHLLETGEADSEILFQLGLAFHEDDSPDSAICYYGRAVAVDSSNSKALVNMGVLFDERGEKQRALLTYKKAARINPEDILAQAHAAFIHFQLGEYGSAWNSLSEANRLDPEHPQPHFYLAIFFWESGIYREAMSEWEKVIELDPDGYLSKKAQENISILQKALNAPPSYGGWKPTR